MGSERRANYHRELRDTFWNVERSERRSDIQTDPLIHRIPFRASVNVLKLRSSEIAPRKINYHPVLRDFLKRQVQFSLERLGNSGMYMVPSGSTGARGIR